MLLKDYIDLEKKYEIDNNYVNKIIKNLFYKNRLILSKLELQNTLDDKNKNQLICEYLNKEQKYWCGQPCEIIEITYGGEYRYKIKSNNIIDITYIIASNYFEIDNENILLAFLKSSNYVSGIKIKNNQFDFIIKNYDNIYLMDTYIQIYNYLDENWLRKNINLLYKINFEFKKQISNIFFDQYFELFSYGQLEHIIKYQYLEEWFIKKHLMDFDNYILDIIIDKDISNKLKDELLILRKLIRNA